MTNIAFKTYLQALTAKTTPADNDITVISDSADSNEDKKVSWVNIKATLKTYFDTLYQASLVSGTNIKTINGATILGSGDLVVTSSPAGSDTQVQFNDGGTTGADPLFTYNKTTDVLSVNSLQIGSSNPFSDSAGTLTLQNVDVLDATTEATIETAIDTLVNLTSIQGRTITLADAGADAILGWDDSADAYENLTQAEVLAIIGDSSETAKGVSELATSAEIITGTDNTRVITPAGFTASFRGIPQNSQSTAYTTVLSDSGKHILHPSADTTARTFTIDSNANVPYPIGTAITFINQNSAGTVTISITSDTMRLAGAGTTGSRTLASNGIATAIKITSTEWIISGTGLT